MDAELEKFSIVSMSNAELFLVQDDQNEIEFDFLIKPMLEIQDESHHQEQEAKDGDEKEEKWELKKPSLGEFKVVDEEDDGNDGFRTPTSLENKIPVIKQCPPAPRKPKPIPSTKRKVPSSGARRNLRLLDLSKDVESLFPQPLLADIGRKIKKARKDGIE
ncbi:hypothetical protein L1049_008258 [Liquidambar formosana]|uniref:Cyclin-dependent protein kinase inhibitor SMR3-like n=1 Tax=Liquidambar formosana TaxID=63359 RepID=A0AAP0X277_LIQFO